MSKNRFSILKRLNSFKYAFNGLKILLKEEHNARIHLIAALCVIIAGFVIELNSSEWLAIIFSIGLVFSTEILNTSIENLTDFVSTEKNDKIKKIKDLAAAGVLVSAVCAVAIGLVIFLPKILALLL